MEGVSAVTPASHTLIVWSSEPDTMLAPSGEKATEATGWLCALCFSALSSRDADTSTGAVRFVGYGVHGVSVPTHLHPTL